jgi:hypothetical protein
MVMNMMKDVVDIVNFACVIAIPKVAPSHWINFACLKKVHRW